MRQLFPIPLEQPAFEAFGTVLDRDLADQFLINQGTAKRFHKMGEVTFYPPKGSVILSIFRGTNRGYPFAIEMMERHPLGSQAFFPLTDVPWLVVVAPDLDGTPNPDSLKCFYASGHQGVQFHCNVWHHPLLILAETQDFFIVDRDGDGNNLEEYKFEQPVARINSVS